MMKFEKLQWLFPAAVTLHNSEEAVSLPKWISAHGSQLPLHPNAARIWFGLLLLTITAFAITYLSTNKGKQSVWAYLLFGYAAAMLINVFVPHIPATLVYREYTPGIATAILLNVPIMSFVLFQALQEQWVSGTKAIAYALLVPLAIAAGILALFIVP